MKTIGILLIMGAVAVIIPFGILMQQFEYPEVLRMETGVILQRFHEGGAPLIFTWLALALSAIPLVIAYSRLGQWLEHRLSWVRWVTVLGIVSGLVQMIGLLRWVFVVPPLANAYVHATDASVKTGIEVVMNAFHQFGGVLLGEHLGQLFTVIYMIGLSLAMWRIGLFPKWLHILGISSAAIYFLAQAELMATVIPGFPSWSLAGLLGSTGWLLWLICLGVFLIRHPQKGTERYLAGMI